MLDQGGNVASSYQAQDPVGILTYDATGHCCFHRFIVAKVSRHAKDTKNLSVWVGRGGRLKIQSALHVGKRNNQKDITITRCILRLSTTRDCQPRGSHCPDA